MMVLTQMVPFLAHSYQSEIPTKFHSEYTQICLDPLRMCGGVKLGIRTEMLGPKSCEALASTCRLCHSLDGCLKFRRSGWSRRVRSQAEKKLKADESEL